MSKRYLFGNLPELTSFSKGWQGPCGDSFCYAGCDSPHCHYDYRLGLTPELHNQKVREIPKEQAMEICRIYNLEPGSELADDVLDLFRRLGEEAGLIKL